MPQKPLKPESRNPSTSEQVDLVGPHEVKELLGVRRSQAYRITSLCGFPAPVAELSSGRIWLAGEVEDWIKLNRARSTDR